MDTWEIWARTFEYKIGALNTWNPAKVPENNL